MSNSSADKLTKPFELHKAGKISLEEYNLLKKKILEETQQLLEPQQKHDVDEESFAEQIIEESTKGESIENAKREISISGNTNKNTNVLKRDPRAKDVANVFWNSKYNLYCKLTDEPISPNENGKYNIWYASHKEPYPNHKILNKEELS